MTTDERIDALEKTIADLEKAVAAQSRKATGWPHNG